MFNACCYLRKYGRAGAGGVEPRATEHACGIMERDTVGGRNVGTYPLAPYMRELFATTSAGVPVHGIANIAVNTAMLSARPASGQISVPSVPNADAGCLPRTWTLPVVQLDSHTLFQLTRPHLERRRPAPPCPGIKATGAPACESHATAGSRSNHWTHSLPLILCYLLVRKC